MHRLTIIVRNLLLGVRTTAICDSRCFFVSVDSGTRKKGGAGLGLLATEKIVNQAALKEEQDTSAGHSSSRLLQMHYAIFQRRFSAVPLPGVGPSTPGKW